MHPFGGTPICPRCSKAVYAAEQVMGPGRKLYHKPCLACTTCGVRLDSFRLLEHDEQERIMPLTPSHSKNCHSKNFGTRDLRQANLPHAAQDMSLTPSRTGATSPSSALRRVASPPLSPSKHSPPSSSARSGPFFSSTTVGRKDTGVPIRGAFSVDSEQTDGTDNSTDQGSDDSQFTPSHAGRSEGGLPRTMPLAGTPDRAPSPIKRPGPATLGRAHSINGNGATGTYRTPSLIPSTTGTRYGAGLMGELRSTPTGSPVRQWGSGTPQCPRCNKNVYFAEQVKAIGKTWHKACLRCSECGTSLDSSRLTERDGSPLCHRCYNKLHGPAGSGYALLGKAGG
ncbi:hypothetical protein BJV74DRAFT_769233 [Russula compacta]|nr:hypothetical protein BJV74DRAFT_769233 [Russula compacta]